MIEYNKDVVCSISDKFSKNSVRIRPGNRENWLFSDVQDEAKENNLAHHTPLYFLLNIRSSVDVSDDEFKILAR